MHLSGSAMRPILLQLAKALPQFGDGLAEALPEESDDGDLTRVDLTSWRPWNGGQVWSAASAPRPASRRGRRRHR